MSYINKRTAKTTPERHLWTSGFQILHICHISDIHLIRVIAETPIQKYTVFMRKDTLLEEIKLRNKDHLLYANIFPTIQDPL